jgi:phosphopantothenoylcysteine decarboxylase/phosphopantothenate--cysteine ligase
MREKTRVLVGITGGIAAYKVPQLVRLLKKRGADVKTVCTPAALRFVGDEALRAVSNHPVYRDDAPLLNIEHIRLAEWADLFIICPATANTIAKIASGIADNLLTTLALSIPLDKLLIAPAMNTTMWENAATRENIRLLKQRGVKILPVGVGELACGTTGAGRMLEPDEIVDFVLAATGPESSLFSGNKILISSGPTEEPIDPVRVITNRSSGKMGTALARAALRLGAEVTVVSGPAEAPLPSGARVVNVRTAAEMRTAMVAEFANVDICIMAAAVGDFRPAQFSATKIKKTEGTQLVLVLEANPDILAELGAKKEKRFLVGFALETEDGAERAKSKMLEKGCDMMVLNYADESLSLDSTRIAVLDRNGESETRPVTGKDDAAEYIMQRIAATMGLTDEQ